MIIDKNFFWTLAPMVIMIIISILIQKVNNYQQTKLNNKMQTGAMVVLSNGFVGTITNINQNILTINSANTSFQCLRTAVITIIGNK